MRVVLAGYNIDSDVIEDLRQHGPPRQDVTPETLSAAYARISRDPRPADELRAVARREVEKARRSNRTIIFKMGHHSVAEHAVFNFDIIGVSRLALEEIERFRLGSYTEKSQRYITLGDDFVVPREIVEAGAADMFVGTVREQNALYHRLYDRLRPYVFDKHRELSANPKNHSVLDGWAKEDARYAVSLATEGQVGLTINARNLELLLRRFAAKRLAELREINEKIYRLARDVAPSIILFTQATDFDSRAYEEVGSTGRRLWGEGEKVDGGGVSQKIWRRDETREGGVAGERMKKREEARGRAGACAGDADDDEPVRLVDYTRDGDTQILAALLHSTTTEPYERCRTKAASLGPPERRELMKSAFRRMEFYDFPLREFEYADLTFAAAVSASSFAQLKRHRMVTLTAQAYDPGLGAAVPPSIQEIGAGGELLENVEKANEAHRRLKNAAGEAADYVLTNAHCRRVLLKVNLRELYHISRLREDPTAQWEIRALAGRMSELAGEAMPLATILLGGKDRYPALYEKLFGRPPQFSPPETLK
jgi:flavin-dependent thymidylate synthase